MPQTKPAKSASTRGAYTRGLAHTRQEAYGRGFLRKMGRSSPGLEFWAITRGHGIGDGERWFRSRREAEARAEELNLAGYRPNGREGATGPVLAARAEDDGRVDRPG